MEAQATQPTDYAVVLLEEVEPMHEEKQAAPIEELATYNGDVLAIFEPIEPLFDIASLQETRMPEEYMCAASEQSIWQALPALPAFVW
jgi:hypothetical protein